MSKLRAPNPHLAARLAETGMSQRELAERMNQQCRQATGKPGTCDARYIRKLLDGTICWPHPRQRQAIEVVLEATSVALGFVPPRNASPSLPPQQVNWTHSEDERPVIRREFLRVAGATVVSVALPAVPKARSISMKDVHEMKTGLSLMHTLDDRYGGGAIAQLAIQAANNIEDAVERGQLPERIELALYSLAGVYTSTAGWFAYDAGDHEVAGKHFDRALRLALISKDSMLQAQTWNYMGHQARWLGRTNEASAIARAGLASTIARRDPKVAALFHARLALGHADRGERGLARRSLGMAKDALNRDDGRERPPWLDFFTPAELAGHGAMAYLTLGQYELAEQRARAALTTIPDTYTRNRIGYTVDLAEAQLGCRAVDSACATAHVALDLAESSQSARSLTWLKSFHTRISVWSTAPAKEWMERYAAVLSQPA